jgi:hypothetical protein
LFPRIIIIQIFYRWSHHGERPVARKKGQDDEDGQQFDADQQVASDQQVVPDQQVEVDQGVDLELEVDPPDDLNLNNVTRKVLLFCLFPKFSFLLTRSGSVFLNF